MQTQVFQNELKTIGLMQLTATTASQFQNSAYRSMIKILYLPAGYTLRVDFQVYTLEQPALFFVSPNQMMEVKRFGAQPGHVIFYNRDFYCIQIHDGEVACDGLLFNNFKNMPCTTVPEHEAGFIDYLLRQVETEFELRDGALEEMVRTYLKQLLIKSARLWKQEHLELPSDAVNQDLDQFRKFSMLVDANYKHKHAVSDYAALLHVAPKTLTLKFKRLNLPQPNEVIKNRIVLEAKRLLTHTAMSAKEIAYSLGYDDPAYFSRLFTAKTGFSPTGFRNTYLSN